jgi:hypothetical protein
MAALRKKIAQKRAEEAAAQPPAPAIVKEPQPKAERASDASAIKSGFLSNGTLYPEGSTEAQPKLWRKGGSEATKLTLSASAAAYVIEGDFRVGGTHTDYIGKEDFKVERQGLTLRVQGCDDNPSSLVSGVDVSVVLPPDAAAEGMTADFFNSTLSIRVPRIQDGPLAELVAKCATLEEAQAVGAALERGAAEEAAARGAGAPIGAAADAAPQPPKDEEEGIVL